MFEQDHEEHPSQEPGRRGQEFLTFCLGGEEYGIDILKVQEIRGYGAVTRIVNAPKFIKGVINLRGVIVPIVDLRIKFGVGDIKYDEFTVVIILHLLDRTVGIVIDSVSDVVTLHEDQIKAAPDFHANFDSAYIRGLATLEEQMLILVDIEKLMNSDEIKLVDQAVTDYPQSTH
ncbi:purine-binding chemotaxis protein CheW [Allopseudospirillum japonicum]|uniref:Chemotaxis protein CheW n=1 Tax=Allopseudospirillum japonicum TaxID=64971 RepID=A0A1H6S1L1_9GAMM|nr:chemotaxis protein CheW [Allopseudospirillum japonicum]SEI60586.1 purine-binding chemotaxis protein CheW [Allopseudospirillum japonicum]